MAFCNINIVESYSLNVSTSKFTIIKDEGRATITASICPAVSESTPYPYYGRRRNVNKTIDLSGKTIDFYISPDAGHLTAVSGTTDSNGECKTVFYSTSENNYTITAKLNMDDQYYEGTTSVDVVNSLDWYDDFENLNNYGNNMSVA
jgi:hypothetical protein